MPTPSITLDSFERLSLADHLAALGAYRHRLAALRAQLALAPTYQQAEPLSEELGRLTTLGKVHASRAQELRAARGQRATKALLDGFAHLQAA